MKKSTYLLWMTALIIIVLLIVPYIYDIFRILFLNPYISIWQQLSLYEWVAIGFTGYCFFHKYIHLNIKWLETDSHEKIHGFIGWLFGRRIHSSHSEEESGMIYTSGQNLWNQWGLLPMALAPYCFPLWTYCLLWIRPLLAVQGRWIFDIILGITLAFHVICFISQTSKEQTDINQYPLSFSFLYIYVARIINMMIIIVAFFPQADSFLYPFIRLGKAMWNNAQIYIHLIS